MSKTTPSWQRYIPALTWVPRYARAHLAGDITAGVTTAVMLIPQAMAYAMLAGLPPVVGLYAAMAPLVVYAIFGTSRQLSVGPAAMVSLLVASGLGALAQAGSTDYLALAIALALLVGVIQTLMGVVRLGFLVNFLSQPVVSGFTSAAALIIGCSQLQHLLGIHTPRGHDVVSMLTAVFTQLHDVNFATLAVGSLAVAALVALKRFYPQFPRALLVVASATVGVWLLGLDAQGVAIIGTVPGGLPMPTLPKLGFTELSSLAPTALTIALVSFMQSISVAKSFARSRSYAIDPNQELIGLGVANMSAAIFGAFPVTGGFSRTAVNAQAGANTALAGVLTALVIGITLLLLTPLLHFLPTAVLAAIILTAVIGLFDVAEVRHLWQTDRKDLALLGLTFMATLGLGIERGILVGVVASMVWFVFETTQPHTAELGRLPGSHVWRNLERHPNAVPEPHVLAVRIDAPLFYGNVAFMKATLARLLDRRPDTRALILDFSPVRALDSSAATALSALKDELLARGVTLHLATVRGPVRDTLQRAELDTHIGACCMHECIGDAIAAIACGTATGSGASSPTPDPPCSL